MRVLPGERGRRTTEAHYGIPVTETSGVRLRRNWIVAAIAGAVAIALAIAVSITVTSLVQPRSSATTTVGEHGFELAVDGVAARGPAGVAPPGTEVRLDIVDHEMTADLGQFATTIGSTVRLELGDDLQPSAPIELIFDVAAGEGGQPFVLGQSDESPLGAEFLETTWSAEDGRLTAQAEHLSWFSPVRVDSASLGERFGTWISEFLGSRTSPPACYGEEVRFRGLTFTIDAVQDDVVWPCLVPDEDTLRLSLQSNSGLVWEVLTFPEGTPAPQSATSLSGAVTLALFNQMDAVLEGVGVVVPRETFATDFSAADAFRVVEVQVEPGLSQVATIMWGLDLLFPASWLEKVARAECLIDIVTSTTSGASADILRTILSCVGTFLGGAVGAVVSILLSAPALLAAQLEGIFREIADSNNVRFDVNATAGELIVTPLPAGATWLYDIDGASGTSTSGDRDDASVVVGGSVATFPHATNQWVGCSGSVAEATYPLDGENILSLAMGIQTHAPSGLTAHVRVRVDGVIILEQSVADGSVAPRAVLDIAGASELTFEAWTDDDCGGASKGYLALIDAYVQ